MGLTVNGGSVSTDTSQNVPVSITKLNIGSDSTGAVLGKAHQVHKILPAKTH